MAQIQAMEESSFHHHRHPNSTSPFLIYAAKLLDTLLWSRSCAEAYKSQLDL